MPITAGALNMASSFFCSVAGRPTCGRNSDWALNKNTPLARTARKNSSTRLQQLSILTNKVLGTACLGAPVLPPALASALAACTTALVRARRYPPERCRLTLNGGCIAGKFRPPNPAPSLGGKCGLLGTKRNAPNRLIPDATLSRHNSRHPSMFTNAASVSNLRFWPIIQLSQLSHF